MSRSVRNPDYHQPKQAAPITYRIERCGGLLVYIPVKESK